MVPRLLFVIGASGVGKTASLACLRARGLPGVGCDAFDSPGVPDRDAMLREFGSGEHWQSAVTARWVQMLVANPDRAAVAVLEGQTRPSFIRAAPAQARLTPTANRPVGLYTRGDRRCPDRAGRAPHVARGLTPRGYRRRRSAPRPVGQANGFSPWPRHAPPGSRKQRLDAVSNMVDIQSIMEDTAPDLNRRIAERVRELRAAHGRSLDALASNSGVSRSMISLIERGESSPTAVVLEKLAAALGVTLASLFDAPAAAATTPSGPVARHADQPQWRDPASGYLRRNVSPPGAPQPMQIVEVHFPPGGRVAFETGGRDRRVHQQVWVLAGAIDVTLGAQRHRLRTGDCLAMQLDRPTMFHNPTRKPARYAVVISSDDLMRR